MKPSTFGRIFVAVVGALFLWVMIGFFVWDNYDFGVVKKTTIDFGDFDDLVLSDTFIIPDHNGQEYTIVPSTNTLTIEHNGKSYTIPPSNREITRMFTDMMDETMEKYETPGQIDKWNSYYDVMPTTGCLVYHSDGVCSWEIERRLIYETINLYAYVCCYRCGVFLICDDRIFCVG